MVRGTICTALAMVLLSASVAEAKSGGRRSSGGSTHYYASPGRGSRGGADSSGQSTPAGGPAQFQPCPPHAPCTTATGLKYVTDPTTGVSRFLPK